METDLLRTMTVDYQRLSELYAGFLVAVGTVSITVITLILILPASRVDKRKERVVMRRHMRISRTFVVTALLVATVSCFVGAHMMAETSAFISHSNEKLKEAREKALLETGGKPLDARTEQALKERKEKSSGERLFLLASSNIFIAAILVLFALMLIPSASGKTSILRVREISFKIFLLVTLSIMFWMILAVLYRMPTPYSAHVLIISILLGAIPFCFLIREKIFYFLARKKIFFNFLLRKNIKRGLNFVFLPIVGFTALLLGYFAFFFGDGGMTTTVDLFVFCSGVSISCGFISAAGLKLGWLDLRKQYPKAAGAKEPVGETKDVNGEKKPGAENENPLPSKK